MTEPSRFADDGYIVVCRDGSKSDGEPGDYVLATRQVFNTVEDAQAVAEQINYMRQPLIVSGRWHQLRL